jgi:hypothetical protein
MAESTESPTERLILTNVSMSVVRDTQLRHGIHSYFYTIDVSVVKMEIKFDFPMNFHFFEKLNLHFTMIRFLYDRRGQLGFSTRNSIPLFGHVLCIVTNKLHQVTVFVFVGHHHHHHYFV